MHFNISIVYQSLSKSGQLLFDDAIVDAKIALHLDPLSLKVDVLVSSSRLKKSEINNLPS